MLMYIPIIIIHMIIIIHIPIANYNIFLCIVEVTYSTAVLNDIDTVKNNNK